jgi:programmed cell death protein 5
MEEDDEELDRLRLKRLQELQAEQQMAGQDQAAEEQRASELEAQKKHVMRQILTPDARERLARLKLGRPDFAAAVEQQLLLLAQTGRLGQKIDDKILQQILLKLQPKKKEIKIKMK